MSEHFDNYEACAETFATLRIDPTTILPDEITRRLGLEPTRVLHAGVEVRNRPGLAHERSAWGFYFNDDDSA